MNEELEDRQRVAHWTFTEQRVAHWGAALLCIITSQGITRVETPHTDLGHVLCDDVEAAPLLHNHPQQLHQVVVPQLPSSNTSGGEKSFELSLAQQQLLLWSLQHCGRLRGGSYVMTEASAMNACAVASFLIHLTATLVPL